HARAQVRAPIREPDQRIKRQPLGELLGRHPCEEFVDGAEAEGKGESEGESSVSVVAEPFPNAATATSLIPFRAIAALKMRWRAWAFFVASAARSSSENMRLPCSSTTESATTRVIRSRRLSGSLCWRCQSRRMRQRVPAVHEPTHT